jgi:hypothetical protein
MSHPPVSLRTLFMAAAAALTLLALPALAQTQAAAKPAAVASKNWTAPRTPDGVPDLQGVWTNLTDTPFERPKELGTKEFFTLEEIAERQKREQEQAAKRLEGRQTEPGTVADVHYDLAQFGLDRSQSKVAPSLRTSLRIFGEWTMPETTAIGNEGRRRRTSSSTRAPPMWGSIQSRRTASMCFARTMSSAARPSEAT